MSLTKNPRKIEAPPGLPSKVQTSNKYESLQSEENEMENMNFEDLGRMSKVSEVYSTHFPVTQMGNYSKRSQKMQAPRVNMRRKCQEEKKWKRKETLELGDGDGDPDTRPSTGVACMALFTQGKAGWKVILTGATSVRVPRDTIPIDLPRDIFPHTRRRVRGSTRS